MKKLSLIGERFGKLTVICEQGKTKSQNILWKCKCDCGKEVVVNGSYLRNGHSKSCGCLAKEKTIARSTVHGNYKSRLYRIWHGMKNRCYYSKNNNFKNYGARGITVCEEWKNDFQAFYEWAMANGYSENLTIDRINPNGNYSPENCKWATMLEQQHNKRNTK